MIAWFGEAFSDRLGKPDDAECEELDQLVTARLGITRLFEKTERFARSAEIIKSVPGLAEPAAAGLIAFLPELGRVDR